MDVDAVALTQIAITDVPDVSKASVLRVVFENLPVPNESRSIEEILDFAREGREQNLVQGLRVFTTELARGDLSVSEIRDKFDHIVAEHERALQLHRRVARRGILETVLLASADVIAAVKTGQFVGAARAALEIRTSNASLLLQEMGLPGREVAYLVRAKEQYGA